MSLFLYNFFDPCSHRLKHMGLVAFTIESIPQEGYVLKNHATMISTIDKIV